LLDEFVEIPKIFEENGCKLISDKYISNDKKLKYICECGRESEITLANFFNGSKMWLYSFFR